jgi:hypothetical protein
MLRIAKTPYEDLTVRITSLLSPPLTEGSRRRVLRNVAKRRWYTQTKTLHSRLSYSCVNSVRWCVVYPGTPSTGLRPLCRKEGRFGRPVPSVKTTFTRPNPVGDRTKWRVDTIVLSLRHTEHAIWTAVWFVFHDTGARVRPVDTRETSGYPDFPF